MAQTPWKFAQTATGWTNGGNIAADDGALVQPGLLGAGVFSAILNAYNFGFTTSDIPTGSTIQGVEFRVKWRRTANGSPVGVQYAMLRLSWGGNDGNNKAASVPAITNLPTSFTLGGAADTWGATVLTLIPDGENEVRSTNFGFTFRVFNADAKYSVELGIDCIEMRVTFTPPATTTTTSTTTTSTTTTPNPTPSAPQGRLRTLLGVG